ncbi:uncharacterized protein N7515_007761 [Penicillium bovifimosum]|uniref:Transferase n=1 Tax=Penicillium bovifimosum TaxID=126998 RepID=A0A9W9GLQ4_9EURO|nr:uncharacterized protein N7515_007761 [Penicillium bovifimosum]KAJ5123936.1 hypothetical protein N7515_007761 [Penicillium bovifimosum]
MVPNRVRVSTRHTLNCQNEVTVAVLKTPFKLGPLDYTVPASLTIGAIFVYQRPASIPQNVLLRVDRLKDAAAILLDYYPHLTGRLQENPASRVAEIVQIGAGVELWEANCDLRLGNIAASSPSNRLLMHNLPASGDALIPEFPLACGAIGHNPILAIQHTRFACGGVALGFRIQHSVCDPTGLLRLVRDLAGIYRRIRDFSPPALVFLPVLHSYRSTYPREQCSYRPLNLYLEEDATMELETADGPSKVSSRVLRFSGPELIALKQAATNPDPRYRHPVSSFEALSAYLYQRIYQARIEALIHQRLPPFPKLSRLNRTIWLTVDMRDPVRLDLSPDYFPNAGYCVIVDSSYTDPELYPRWMIASYIHYAFSTMDMHRVIKTLEWVAAQRDKSRIRSTTEFREGCFAISEWTKEDTYFDVDFDVDQDGDPITPSLVAKPFTEVELVDGLAYVMSTEEKTKRMKQGLVTPVNHTWALDVYLALNDSVWTFLDTDPNFRKLYA